MKEALQSLGVYLEAKLKAELISQGHVASRKLLESIDLVISRLINGWQLHGEYLVYGTDLDTGTLPGRKIPIKTLIDWMRLKKILFAGKSELQTAFLIQNAIFKKGTPTNRSSDKLRWMSKTLEASESKIVSIIEEAAFSEITILVSNMVEASAIKFETLDKSIAA